MTHPTVLSPWYVVQQVEYAPGRDKNGNRLHYVREGNEEGPTMTANPNEATLYMSLTSAARVAKAVAGEVRVLVDQDDLKEFRPKGEI